MTRSIVPAILYNVMRIALYFLNYWLPPLSCMGLIFFLSSLSNPPSPDIGLEGIDKFFHFIAYAGLSFWVIRAFLSINQKVSPYLPWAAAILVVLLYAASDEWHQLYVKARTPDVADWIADSLGGTFGIFTMYMHHRFSRRFSINKSQYN